MDPNSNSLPPRVPLGVFCSSEGPDLRTLGVQAKESGQDFLVVPISRPQFKRYLFDEQVDFSLNKELRRTMENWREGNPFSLDDLFLRSVEFADMAVGKISEWIDLDSPDVQIRINSEIAMKQEIAWATHLGLSAVLLPFPNDSAFNYARSVHSILGVLAYTHVWLQVPLILQEQIAETKETITWERWNQFRTLCEHHVKLSIALELTADLPDNYILERWFGEPIKAVIVPTNIFLTNAKGYPVLSRKHQAFVRRLMRIRANFIISDTENRKNTTIGGTSTYQEYLRHLNRTMPELSEVEKFATGYQDYLQSPLQAVYHALLDRVQPNSQEITVIMVVGAGRGPLVTRSLAAAEKANRPIRVYAIEKNPNAFVTLQNMKAEVWGDKVTIAFSDMRRWKAPEKADIIVSELLGSFGDNELSPECLDGAQKFLKEDGISIPANYITYIAPLSSSKLHSEAAAYKDLVHFETPYVVMFQAVTQLADPQIVWKFEHPNKQLVVDDEGNTLTNFHNTRYSKNTFTITDSAILHGIAGFFESVLYKNITMSIHPKTHSEGMFSWFPIFFPLKTPIFLPGNSKINVHFWRLTDSRKVWYEWCVDHSLQIGAKNISLGTSVLHNVGGRSSWIGL
ncbi:3805_t:CDS:10 [Ambispora leptoticha]|uniref:Protein arginine N-methyltransferase n=1 Tax=Ambispora leptoticha TaxID=144679 RepID=A0A9N9CB69_9GLOM|nr:3805_t:CDS:10 [Ambispora leptoticha]